MNLSISNFINNHRFAWYIISGYLVGCVAGLLIVQDNPFLLLMSFAIPFGIILFTYPTISFYLIMFSVFFADWLMDWGLIPPEMTLLPELALLILTVKIIILRINDRKFIKTTITVPILLFVFWGLISTVINSQNMVTTIIGFRFDLKYVLMFFVLINLSPDERFFKRMIFTLIVLLLIQIPVALVKLTIYGQGEWAIGTYAVHGGTISTILPLAAISIFLGFFLFEKPRLRYIFFSLSFVLFSIIGGKRAFPFLGLLLFLFLFWQAGTKNIAKFSFLAPFFMMGLLACIYFVPSLNPAFKNPRHLIDFSISYSTAHSVETGKAIGRTSALKAAYTVVRNKPVIFLLGFGPGSMSVTYLEQFEGKLRNELPLAYGQSQWVTMSLEYGYIGVLLFLCLFPLLFKANQRFFTATSGKYWKAISFGFKGMLFTYLMGFFYGTVFRIDVLAFIFWFFAATIYCLDRQRKIL